MSKLVGILSAVWGVLGVSVVLVYAIFRLSEQAIGAFSAPLAWYHIVLLAANVAFMAYSEGYKGFQKRFAPRVVARAIYLTDRCDPATAVLAPLFCAGYFRIARSRQIAVIAMTLGIIILVTLVRQLPQPWRGIIDAGVVVGLTWGVLSMAFFAFQAFVLKTFHQPTEIPSDHQ